MHVEGHLTLLLNLLLVVGTLVVTLGQQTLSQELLGPSTQLDVQEGVVSVPNLGMSESAEPQLDHSPVIKDLGQGVGMRDGVLEAKMKAY